MQAKTLELIEAARVVLSEFHPMTVRQVFYQLVSRQVLKNTMSQYKRVCRGLRDGRKEGLIPWDWIEDRLRRPRTVSMWDDLPDFSDWAAEVYRRDVWADQPGYLEVWLEKDALSGIFEDVLEHYGVTLNVGRGYDGWSSIREAAHRFGRGRTTEVLYFGDFDPSGEDMFRSLQTRLGFFGCFPTMVKSALRYEDIERYSLPPEPTKGTDTRRGAFIEQHGDVCVELDALPIAVLRERIVSEVESRMDLDALEATRIEEGAERDRLRGLLGEGE